MYDSIVESIPPFSKLNYIYRVLIRVVRGGSTGPRADANGACPFEPESWGSSAPILVYHKPTGVVIKYCTCSSFSAGTKRNETKQNATAGSCHYARAARGMADTSAPPAPADLAPY